MFRYVLVIFLVNYYIYGLGNPIPTHDDDGVQLAEKLVNLAKTCTNSFIKQQIISKIEECDKKVPPYDQHTMKCMLFYDINSRLCSDDQIGHMKLDDTTGDISKEQVSVLEICRNAMTWNFTHMPEFENYKNYSEIAFRNISQCSKICMISKYINDDSSYFCKYYNWGSKTYDSVIANRNLKSSPVSDVEESEKPALRVFGTDIAPEIPQPDITKVAEPKVVSVNETSTIMQTAQSGSEVVIPPVKEESKKDENIVISPQAAPNKENDVPQKELEEPTGQEAEEPAKNEATVDSKPPTAEQKPTDKATKEKPQLPAAENSKANNFSYVDDDIDSDGDVGAEVQDADVNADIDEQLNKPLKQESKSNSVQMLEPVIGNNKRIVITPDVIEDNFPEQEEDHFFSFFLSAVVLIIVLYVLYHNKSKVNKVVLGLLVEGRQSGRRRNSRGHAYRRLDTLEQAISTNPTAAPAKIIY